MATGWGYYYLYKFKTPLRMIMYYLLLPVAMGLTETEINFVPRASDSRTNYLALRIKLRRNQPLTVTVVVIRRAIKIIQGSNRKCYRFSRLAN